MSIMIGMLAALGCLMLLWCFAGLILLPVSGCDMVTVWQISGVCTDLEYRTRGYLLLCSLGLCGARLVLVDCGMCEETAAIAKRLSAAHDPVDLVPLSDLESYLDQVRTYDGRT